MNERKGYLIYLDLLGYKNIIKGNSTQDIDELRAFIDSFSEDYISKKARLMYGASYRPDKLFYKSYSDNFLIFYENEENEKSSLPIAIALASSLLGAAIQAGFMLRGSIVFGELEFNDHAVFGKSIIEAYELENNHIDPSVVLSSELQRIYTNEEYYKEDLLSPFSMYFRDDYDFAKTFVNGIGKIVKRLNYQSIVDERTLEKYRWLIKEFNRYYGGRCELVFIEGPSHFDLEYSDTSANI